MTALAERPELMSVAERRRVLCEFADQYTVEQHSADRPITDALPSLLWLVVAAHHTTDGAVDLFDRFARARAVSGDGTASYDTIHAAEARAEKLLDQLVGEAPS